MHSETRIRELIDKLYNRGLWISYHRMLALSTNIGNTMCSQFQRHNIVCPSILKRNLFATNTIDKVDHDPCSRSAKDAFHGTSIYLST